MNEWQTLGALAHRGGLLVQRPELTVGMVRAVSRPSGLEVELLARQPLDRRDATQRQQDIRAGRGRPSVAPRRLLPAFDEGTDLRVGWLDQAGRAHWEFGNYEASSGDNFQGTIGPSFRTVLTFPPMFEELSLVLAWPELGFPEAVVTMPLPDRATVERETRSIWEIPPAAPVDTVDTESLNFRVAAVQHDEPAVEAGRIVAAARVLHRTDDTAVAVTRLTAVGPTLSLEILSVARDAAAGIVTAAFPPWRPPSSPHDSAEQIRANGPGASVAVVRGDDAFWLLPTRGSSFGDGRVHLITRDFTLDRPEASVLDLLLAWPSAGVADVRVRIPLD